MTNNHELPSFSQKPDTDERSEIDPFAFPSEPPLHLNPSQKRLYGLFQEAGRIPLTRDDLLAKLREAGTVVLPQHINATIHALRQTLEKNEKQPLRITNIQLGRAGQAYYVGHHIDDPRPLPEIPPAEYVNKGIHTGFETTLSPAARARQAREARVRKNEPPQEIRDYFQNKIEGDDTPQIEYVRNDKTGEIWIVSKRSENGMIILTSLQDPSLSSSVSADIFPKRYTQLTKDTLDIENP